MADLTFDSVASLMAAIFSLAIAGLAYSRERVSPEVHAFAFVSTFIGLWTLFPFLTALPVGDTARTMLARATYLGALFGPPAFVWLVEAALPVKRRGLRRAVRACWGVSGVLAFFVTSPLFITTVVRREGLSQVRGGPLFHAYVAYFVMACAYAFYELWRGMRAARGHKRNQLKYYLIAFLAAYLGGGLHFLSVYTLWEPIPHDIFIIIYTTLLAYAIVKHHVMELTLAVRYAMVRLLFAILVAGPLVFLVLATRHPGVPAAAIVALALLGPSLYRFLKEWLTETVDRLPLFRGRYERFADLQELLGVVGAVKTLPAWGASLVEAARALCPVPSVAVMTRDEPRRRFLVRSSWGLDPAAAVFMSLPMDRPLARRLADGRGLWVGEATLRALPPADRQGVLEDLRSLRAVLCGPLLQDGGLYGFLALGEKTNGDAFNDLELASLTALSRTAEHSLRVVLSGLAREQTTAVWAHDLMKPFTPKGTFGLLEELAAGPLPAEAKTVLALVLDDARFVRRNLERVLHPGQPEVYHVVPGPLTGLYRRVRDKYARHSLEKRLRWRVDPPPEDLRVFCDPVMVEHRVVANLVENAFRHTPPEGAVTLGYRVAGDRFIGYVEDTGPGIRPEDIPKLFAARVQLEGGEPGAAGLGLLSARLVLEAQRGRIWVESPGGARFHFELPLASAAFTTTSGRDT